jgi:hypothetical protein
VSIPLPDPDSIRQRMAACRDELKALRKLLRLSLAARAAEEARARRVSNGLKPDERRTS